MTSRTVGRPRRDGWLLAAAGSLLLTACADGKPLNTFEPRGPKAQSEYDLMFPYIWGIMGIVFVIVVIGGIAVTIKNRVKPEDFDPDDLPEQVHGNFKVEIGWTIVPAIILAVIAVPTVVTVLNLEKKNDPQSLDVMVIGRQWWWEYRYDVDGDGFFRDSDGDGQLYGPNGEGGDTDDLEYPLQFALDPDDVSTAGELVIPAGQQVDLYITSGDVIHSFWIPRLNGKRDAVPGRLHTWSLQADEPGKYTGWCTEFCGLSHARMRMSAIALSDADFATWWANQQQQAAVPDETADPEAYAGYQTFQQQCMSCHIINDGELDYNLQTDNPDEVFKAALVSGAAPNLTHFATRTSFAGAIYSQWVGIDPNDDALDVSGYADIGTSGEYRWNEAELKRWISNAPSRKDAAADEQRGMPAFPQLTEEQLNQLVAYLATLD